MTSRLGSVGQSCSPVSGEGSGQGGMLMSDSHRHHLNLRALPPPMRVAPQGKQGAHIVGVGFSIIPNTGGLRWIEVMDSMRRSGRDHGAMAQERK
ncbi:hypothetical protein PoB_006580700 [Plakobranchus ocellatus]|uniref:Uncharacterized protein n=1 Tax=Plakobranchus ocellatus TaxID=259542 RepID=A0AAV4D526_9GAST|nr:hypothetical protein PoB_006580700 [Plakobranchus ocellatus]